MKIIPHLLKNAFLFLGIASIIYKSLLSAIACVVLYSIFEMVCKMEDGK
jgi:type IV secretory pathway VirB3-like protein